MFRKGTLTTKTATGVAKTARIGKVATARKFTKILTVITVMTFMLAMFTMVASAAAPAGGGAEATYQTVINFFITWLTRIGMLVALVGAIMFALAIKSNDAEQKQAGLLTMVAGFVVAAVCGAAGMFNLFA